MRICIDTNLLIAALTKRDGASARIVEAWLDGDVEVVTSEATQREAKLVLGGGWLARMTSRSMVDDLLENLRTRTVVVDPDEIDDIGLKDEGDRRMVEAAVAGGAEYVVTTDREFLSRRGYRDTEFVTPRELLETLRL
ncbi:MAG: putative toxin-antitoxin system toxin component, PIN family [Chloroflexi bacterium]|nr:putative toxin-antitoxin system toxin component, PIN family [Chloroflexota bacterium]